MGTFFIDFGGNLNGLSGVCVIQEVSFFLPEMGDIASFMYAMFTNDI
jgi:hypothetical protein